MDKYERVRKELKETGTSKMKCIGNSMRPRILSHSTVTFNVQESYDIDDIVMCKVSGKMRVHLILAKDTKKGYLIGNNRGHENGWTHAIWGKAVRVVSPNE